MFWNGFYYQKNQFNSIGILYVGIHNCQHQFPEIHEWCAAYFVEEKLYVHDTATFCEHIFVDILWFYGRLVAFETQS